MSARLISNDMALTPRTTRHVLDQSALPDTLQFMQLLWAVVHALQKTSKRMARARGVTGPQRLVVRVIGLFPGLSPGQLAAILHVHPSTLTGILLRLTTQGLIVRADYPHDRRRAVLQLTRRGARTNADSRGTVEAAVAAALEGVSHRDRWTTRRVLERLADYLERPTAERMQRETAHRSGHSFGKRNSVRRSPA